MKQEKTDKRYILIKNSAEWYNAGEIHTVEEMKAGGNVYSAYSYRSPFIGLVHASDAIEVSLVVIDGMLYAVSDEIKMCDYYMDDTFAVRVSITSDKEYWSTRKEYKKLTATSNPALISDGVLPIKNADEVMRGLEGEKEQRGDDDFWGKPDETDERYITSHHKFNQSLYDLDLAAYNKSKAAPVPADTDKEQDERIKQAATDYAERVCSGDFPIKYTRDQVVKHDERKYTHPG